MAEVLTDKAVNLTQLGEEIGGSPAWRMVGPDADGLYRVCTDDVDQADLKAAVEAHDPQPVVIPPEPDPLADLRAAVEGATTVAQVKAALLDVLDVIG